MNDISPKARDFWQHVLARAALFFAFWIILTLGDPADLVAGVVATIAATSTSLYLLPGGEVQISPSALIKFTLHFFYQSVVAGLDVAKRALDPRLPLQPGYVQFPCKLTQGPARNAFCALASLLPGTVPVTSDRHGVVLIHCLDVGQPVLAQLAQDEILFGRVAGGMRDNG
jgi:multicomponent Na+:H+ antiporter subunit E